MDLWMLLRRILHIGAAAFWVGAAFTFFLFVVPSANALEPPATKKFMDTVTKQRRFPTFVLAATVVTVVAGALLYWRVSGGFRQEWLSSPTGIGFTVGALAGIVSFLIVPAFIAPTIDKLQDLGDRLERERRPPDAAEGAEFGRLSKRLRTVGAVDLVFLSIALLLMATARYFG